MLYIVKIFLLTGFFVAFCLSAGTKQDFWAGCRFSMPNSGEWCLTAAHGRVILRGNGRVEFTFPEIEKGGSVEIKLLCGGAVRIFSVHSQQLLYGYGVVCREPDIKRKLELLGASVFEENDPRRMMPEITGMPECSANAPLTLCFPAEKEFPVRIKNCFEKVLLCKNSGRGNIGVVSNANECIFDLNGRDFCAIFSNGAKEFVLFSSNFDFNSVKDVIFLKKLLMECGR